MSWDHRLDKIASIIVTIISGTIHFIRKLIADLKSRNEIAKRSDKRGRFKPHYVNAKSQIYIREKEYVITHPENFVDLPADSGNILRSSESIDEKLSRTKWF